jgi:hypothetical protein
MALKAMHTRICARACLSTVNLGQDIPLVSNARYQSEFVEGEKLGKGGFGTVYLGSNRLDGRDYAIKKIRLASDLRCRAQLEKVHATVVRYMWQ